MNEKNEIIQKPVWDLFVRFFHWSLALLFIVAYLTGDEKDVLHRYIGYAMFGLVLVRIVWGFFGTKYALFSEFFCSPAKALNYLKELASGKPKYYTGHNPAAAWMIISLLALTVMTCVSGYAAFTGKGKSPSFESGNVFSIITNVYADDDEYENHKDRNAKRERHDNSGKDDDESDSIWGDIHEIFAQLMLIFICFHILGVAVSSKMHHENLVKSMITGTKTMHGS